MFLCMAALICRFRPASDALHPTRAAIPLPPVICERHSVILGDCWLFVFHFSLLQLPSGSTSLIIISEYRLLVLLAVLTLPHLWLRGARVGGLRWPTPRLSNYRQPDVVETAWVISLPPRNSSARLAGVSHCSRATYHAFPLALLPNLVTYITTSQPYPQLGVLVYPAISSYRQSHLPLFSQFLLIVCSHQFVPLFVAHLSHAAETYSRGE